jgi:hypothetical protein
MGSKTAGSKTAIGKAAICVATTVIFALKAPQVKAAADEISGIPSFKEGPIVGIVVVIPIVAVPGRIVIIDIPGECIFKDYSIGSILIGVGVSVLIRGIWLLIAGRRGLVTRSGRLVSRRGWRRIIYLRIAADGD